MVKRKRTKGQTMIYKTLHRKLQIEQHESHKNVVPEGLSASGINVREYRWGTSRMKNQKTQRKLSTRHRTETNKTKIHNTEHFTNEE